MTKTNVKTLYLYTYIYTYIIFIYIYRQMGTKNGKVVTYFERLSPANSQNSLNVWSRKVTWKIKNTFPLSQCLWPPNLSGWWHTARSSHPQICIDPLMWWWICEITWQFKYISTCRKTMDTKKASCWLKWKAATCKAIWHFDHVTTMRSRGNLINFYLHFHKICNH